MMRTIMSIPVFLFFYFTLFIFSSTGQTFKTAQLTDSLLKKGNFKAAIIFYDFPSEIKALQSKALSNLKQNPQWKNSYLNVQIERGDHDIKFIDAYGLNKNEFEKMISGFKNRKVAFHSDTSIISIKKTNNIITFQANGKLSLFNFLKIDVKKGIIDFDNLKVTKELEIDGKFYAPALHGFESYSSKENGSVKPKTEVTYFGFSIGRNKNDIRPTLCLIHGKPTKNHTISQSDFLIITIL